MGAIGPEVVELAKISRRVYPGPLNQQTLTISGLPLTDQRYVHGSAGRGFCRILHNDRSVVVAFRGTREKYDWTISNLRFALEPLRDGPPGSERIGVHRGFQGALNFVDKTSGVIGLERILDTLRETTDGRELWITGHSLGAAIATVFAVKLRARMPNVVTGNLRRIVLFGSPAVGGAAFRKHYAELGDKTVRYTHGIDPVPFTPPVGFRHVGAGYWFHDGAWMSDPGWPTRLRVALRRKPWVWARDHSMEAYLRALAHGLA